MNSMGRLKPYFVVFLTLLVIYTLLRLIFFAIYYPGGGEVGGMLWWGLRFDFSILFLLNLPLFFYTCFIQWNIKGKAAHIMPIVLACLVNIPLIVLECIDLAYFSFSSRRAVMELLGSFGGALPAYKQFLRDYTWIIAGGCLMIASFVAITLRAYKSNTLHRNKSRIILIGTLYLVSGALLGLGKGGRPIMPATPLLHFEPQWQPFICNSAFSLIYSAYKGEELVKEKHYFTPRALDTLYPVKQQYAQRETGKPNIVLVIMESMAPAYLSGASALRAETPFLDSIREQSTWFSNAYANGLQSNQGLVAILAGLPPIMDVPYYYSSYASNKFKGVGALLKQIGYTSHFFYGAEKDHFGFGKLTNIVGIENYYSKESFGKDGYDGYWGVYDHLFLPFAAKTLRQEKAPFFAVVYNVSTHPPYAVPSAFVKHGVPANLNGVAYYDYALSLFFEEIKQAPWYKNTVFLFVADHSVGPGINKTYNALNAFRIPMFSHKPLSAGPDTLYQMVQQADLVPSMLKLAGVEEPFVAFGQAMDEQGERYLINRFNKLIQVIDKEFILAYSIEFERSMCLFKYSSDPQLEKNLLKDSAFNLSRIRLEQKVRAFIQQHNHAMLNNKLTIQ